LSKESNTIENNIPSNIEKVSNSNSKSNLAPNGTAWSSGANLAEKLKRRQEAEKMKPDELFNEAPAIKEVLIPKHLGN
jgi:hypothetical protein